jgi:hypothetical protein
MDCYSAELKLKAGKTSTVELMVRLMDCLLVASLAEKSAEKMVMMTD